MRNWTIGGALLAGALVITACVDDSVDENGSAAKFEQTWPQPYNETTCEEWESAMTAEQRRVAAADMLVGARSQDGGDSLPPDSLIAEFRDDISTACEADPALAINEVAVGVYLTGAEQYRP